MPFQITKKTMDIQFRTRKYNICYVATMVD